MIIDQYISELLFQHDCVIVPEFGGFVANYAPARIHPTQHTFSPPSKNIVFNKNLKTNDGLLANKMVLLDAVASFPEAAKLISRQVEQWNKELAKGGKVIIREVGTLYRDVEHNIQFEPDRTLNYLIDSFGFSTIQSPAIRRDNYQHRIEKEFKDRVPVLPAVSRKINIKKYVKLALIAPVLLAAIWIPLKTDWLKQVNYSTLNPFAGKIKPLYIPKTAPVLSVNSSTDDTDDYFSALEDTSAAVNISFVEGGLELLTVKLRDKKTPETLNSNSLPAPPPVTMPVTAHFYIIAGCFENIDNAENLVSSLQEQSISASIIGTNEAGLHMVSYGQFSVKRKALEMLSLIREAHNPHAWLLKK